MSPHRSSMTKTESPGPSERRTFLSTSGFDEDDVALLEVTPDNNVEAATSAPGQANEDASPIEHVIGLSSIDHCMPRAYIRVCLAFRLPPHVPVEKALAGLGRFLSCTVAAAPFLAGYVHPSPEKDGAVGRLEIRFTDADVRTFPTIQTRQFTSEEMLWTYDELSEKGLPPSTIRPDLVSALPENTNDGRAPVFRVQANIVEGGLIVSIYLHHCVTDGSGLGLVVSGGLLTGTGTGTCNHQHLNGTANLPQMNGTANLPQTNGNGDRAARGWNDLASVTSIETLSRSQLRRSKGYDMERQISYNVAGQADTAPAASITGRGCVFVMPQLKMSSFKTLITKHLPKDDDDVTPFISDHDVLQALLWHHLSQARRPSLSPPCRVTTSTLLIPVNIRGRMLPPLPSSFFGSAVDFASVKLSLAHLSNCTPSAYALTALAIRHAVRAVQDAYVRATIKLSNTPNVDVRDLQAANMNRTTGADMYITSWLGLPLYEKGDLWMGLGQPDWVRKPWSRDPGACIILPQDPRRHVLEVVVQMAAEDMERLLRDEAFMDFVDRTIE